MTDATTATTAAGPRKRPALPIPAEGEVGGWLTRCARTCVQLFAHPEASFAKCPEPVDHGRVLRFLATLRIPLWLVAVALAGFLLVTSEGPEPIKSRSIHNFIDPQAARAISTWLLLMVPVGLPVLYFLAGLVAHIGIALTGGAPRSIGASMRAVGYALAPALVAIGLLDIPLYLGLLEGAGPSLGYTYALGAVLFLFLSQAGVALARTHQIGVARGFVVAVLPLLVFGAATYARASLELTEVPGVPKPTDPYFVP